MKPDDLHDWLSRGAASLRTDARRALDELVSRGDLPAEEAARLEQAVADALERSQAFVSDNVMAPLRELLAAATGSIRSAVGHDDDVARLDARLAALDERLERIERRLEDGRP